ncbi:hypothetical protein AgCh_040359 [Apium graveolens]
MVLETMANIGLLYFLFIVGVEMDITSIKRTGKKAILIAIAGMILPFLLGVSFSFFLRQKTQMVKQGTFILFLGVALSVTAFPVLARILAELKLLNKEIGQIAMSSALVNDIVAWTVLAFAIAMSENNNNLTLASLWVIISSVVFVMFCIFVVRPTITWMIRRTPEGETISEFNLCVILTGVMISGFITDAIGTHSVFGAFVFGLVIPNGPLVVTLIERLEDFVSGLLLPIFFAISGLKTEFSTIQGAGTWGALIIVIVLACLGKVAGTALVAVYYRMPVSEGITLGLLMNTKGLVEMIVLNVGKDQKVLDEKSFAIMVIVAVVMTGSVTPIVTTIYRPARKFSPYKIRTIQRTKQDGEFRILACIHTPRNAPTIINLIEASHPCKKSPICIYVLHLVELTGRASAMLIVHNAKKSGPAANRTQAQSDNIISAFKSYEHHATGITVQPLTAVSPYSTMHEDICNVAEDKRVALIIVPFHKQQTVDGGMENLNPSFRTINQNVLINAPCSVGILVDRGLSGSTRISTNQITHHIALLFFGGPDDREALAYAWRMSTHPGINLTVMRFISANEAVDDTSRASFEENDPRVLTILTDNDKEKQLNEECLNSFKSRMPNDGSIIYIEKTVNNGQETVAAIRSIDNIHDLFIVGRGRGSVSPLTAGLTDWSECPELGVIGDLLASSDFAATVSVLVIQQYVGMASANTAADTLTPDTPQQVTEFSNSTVTQRTPPTAASALVSHPEI